MNGRLCLPRLSFNEARARSLIGRHVADRVVPALGAPQATARLTLQPLPVNASPAGFTDPRRLEFDWAGARFDLQLPASALDAWLRGALGGVAVASLPEAWREAALARAARCLLDALDATGRGRVRLLSSDPAPAEPPRHGFAFTLRFEESGEALHGRLHADGLGLLLAAGLVSGLPALEPPQRPPPVPVPLWLSLGETDLPLGTLRSLAPGDVVFVQRRYADDDGHLMLIVPTAAGSWGLRVRLAGTEISIVDAARPVMTDAPAPEPTQAVVPLDQVPVRLSFDLGEKLVPLAELQRLQPGQTLALDRPVDRCVTVRANGAPIGIAELVDIDGRIGVSLLSMHVPPLPTEADDGDVEEEGR